MTRSGLFPTGGDDEQDAPQRDDQGRQEPQHDEGKPAGPVVYTAQHTYGDDAQGDHLVRVVSPVGVFAEFIGTPGAELVILTPPHQSHVPPNGKLNLQAWIKFPDPDHPPQQVTAQAEWASSNKQIISVGNHTGVGGQGAATTPGATAPDKGVITGRRAGRSRISVVFGGLKVSKVVECREADAQSLSIEPANGKRQIRKGEKLPLRSTATFTDGRTQAVTNKTKWSSEDPKVASVSPTGEVTGVGGGTAVITGKYESKEGQQTMAKLKVTVEAELDGQKTDESAEDQDTGQNEQNETSEDSSSENSGSDSSSNPSESTGQESGSANGDSTFPPNGGAQDAGQGGASETPAQGGAQDASQGGVQPQYGQ